jgi:regulator of protease activity HflC (stomatin/prohibitin superfamily)
MLQSISWGIIVLIAGYLTAWGINKKNPKLAITIRYTTLVLTLIAIIGGTLFLSIRFVEAGERGVLLRWGAVQETILQEGFHIVNPISDQVIIIDIRVQKDEIGTEAASKDLQIVTSTIATNYHLDPEKVNWIYQNIGQNYLDRVISPSVEESIKAVTAKYTATELLTKRSEVKLDITNQLKERLTKYDIIIDDVSIIDFQFSDEFNAAIEQKQISQQEAERAEYLRQKAEIEKQTVILQAQGEAEAQRLQAETLTPDVIKKLEIERDLQAIYNWDGHLPTYVGGDNVPFIDLRK